MLYCKSLNYFNDIYGNILLYNGAIEISFESQKDSKAYLPAVNQKMLNHDKIILLTFWVNPLFYISRNPMC